MQLSYEIEFGNLELLAKQVVEGFITGLHKSPFHGFSVEFAEHRIYNQGESTRHIDWKLYGRTDRLYTKKYEEETNLRCHMLIDCSNSMYFPVDSKPNKISLFSESLLLHTQAKSSPSHQRFVYAELEKYLTQFVPAKGKDTHLASVLHEVAEIIHKRSLVMLFTDFWTLEEDPHEVFNAINHLKHERHEVIVFHLFQRKHEAEFSFDNRPFLLVDMESGEEIRMLPNEYRNQYRTSYAEHLQNLALRCGDLSVDFVPVAVEDPLDDILIRYLLKRQQMH
jgi:uncharacterized protein (DUF58 family)